MSGLCDLSAIELRALIGRKAILPSELMTASIKRIEGNRSDLECHSD